MGNFYSNISVRTMDRGRVIHTLREQNRVAFVSQLSEGWVVVYDRDIETADPADISSLAGHLSTACAGIVFPVADYDDDVLWFSVYDCGKVIDEYDSAPGYFEGTHSPPSGGNARALVTTFQVPGQEDLVKAILHERDYAVQIERHAELARALRLPRISVGFGYRYIERGEFPPDMQADFSFIE